MRLSNDSIDTIVDKIAEELIPEYLKPLFKMNAARYLSSLNFNDINLKPFPPGLRDIVLEIKDEKK